MLPNYFRIIGATIFIALGTSSVLFQYYINASLWQDEAALALNVVTKSYSDLYSLLDYSLIAPAFFLYLEKTFSTIFPNTDYGLRFFPLVSFFLCVPLIYKVTLLLKRDSIIAIIALSLFCTSPLILNYSVEVKQYMTDALVTLLLFYLAQILTVFQF